MRTIPHLTLLLFFLVLQFFFFSEDVLAESKFAVGFSSTYNINKDGETEVIQKIALKNLTTNLFAKEFNLTLGSPKIEQIKAKDSLGPIETSVNKGEDFTKIHLVFNDKVVGEQRVLNFEVSYKIADLAQKNGQMWEVSIPRLLIEEEITDYSLSLKIPSEFGELHYVTHEPEDRKEREFTFKSLKIAKDGLALSFGKYQVFDFKLNYNLFNPSFFPSSVKIAIPPDREYQQVIFEDFKPKPDSILLDQDGNYIATYKLNGRQKMTAEVRGKVKIVDSRKKLQPSAFERDNPDKYLKSDRYWEVNDPTIQKLAKELKTPEEIYNFVSSNLKYGYSRLQNEKIERLGALGALSNKNLALCMEFTDLFVAISRAAGIPAREINGFAYTQNKKLRPTSLTAGSTSDILHAWPEYFDKNSSRWVAIDPTWGSTSGVDYFNKLDTNHFVFSIKGSSSSGPLPAGAYKFKSSKEQDVLVEFAKSDFEIKPEVEVKFVELDNVPLGFSKNGLVKIKNLSNASIFNNSINLEVENLRLLTPSSSLVEVILPNQEGNIPVKVSSGLRGTSKALIKVRLGYESGGEVFEKELVIEPKIKPIFLSSLIPVVLAALGVLGVSIVSFFIFKQLKSLNR